MKTGCILLLFAMLQHALFGQTPTCKELHNGITNTYGGGGGDRIISIMEKNKLTQVVINLDDTVSYRVDWMDECSFTMQYISGGKRLPKRILDFNANHIFYYTIEKVTDEYFIGRVNQDKPKGRMLGRDTSWFAPKESVAASNDFEKVSSQLVDAKTVFRDSAEYALVYVYRPKRTMLLLATYPLYFDDQLMCTVENNSGYIFKVRNEGVHTFTTKLLKDSAGVSIDLRFGKRYYIKPWIEWGIKQRGYNFKLHIEEVSDLVGVKEFEEVRGR